MNRFYDDHSGEDEVVEPAYPETVDRGHETPAADEPVLPSEVPADPGYRIGQSPTQPAEPIYPSTDVVEEPANVDNDNGDENFLDRLKRWFREAPEEIKKDLDDR